MCGQVKGGGYVLIKGETTCNIAAFRVRHASDPQTLPKKQ